MLPVYKEYIQFIEDTTGVNVTEKFNLKEGYFWQNNQIIKAFDKQGNLHKLFRVHTDDNLETSISYYKVKPFAIESWEETVQRNISQIVKREGESISTINKFIKQYPNHNTVVLTSMGKDSMVVQQLVNQCNNNHQIVFNNTSLDCADTYTQVKKYPNIQIVSPKEGFYQWRDRLNFIPTRISRACCTVFKEGETINQYHKDDKILFFLGMRADESSKRSEYTSSWRNEKWGDRDWQGCLPIVEWSDFDVWLYTLYKNIDVNSKYKKGYSRVGCAVACPNYTKATWVLDKYWYPKGFKRWHDILDKDFVDNNKDIIMNCTQDEYHMYWNGGTLRKEPTTEVIEQFANRNGIDFEIAKKYFNHSCATCDKKIKSKEVLAMNLKLNGRSVNKFYCKKHLMDIFSINKDEWNIRVKEFKNDGCVLF